MECNSVMWVIFQLQYTVAKYSKILINLCRKVIKPFLSVNSTQFPIRLHEAHILKEKCIDTTCLMCAQKNDRC